MKVTIPGATFWIVAAAIFAVTFAGALPASAAGTIEGSISFDGLTSFPTAVITIEDQGSPVAGGVSSRTDGSFSVSDVPNGSYDVVVTAPCFGTETVGGISVADDTTDVGLIILFVSTTSLTSIQIAGDFTGNFDLGQAPFMTQGSNCVWSDTVNVASGTYFFKFVSDGAFDNPPDYGGDEGITLSQPGGPHDTFLVSGPGTAIKIEILATGDYIFTLDEAAQTFTTSLIGGAPTGAVSGTVAFSGITTGPYPAAAVKLMDGATTVRTTTSDPTDRTFSMDLVADGTYSVEVSSPCFTTQVVSDVVVVGGNTATGTITLPPGVSQFSTIQLAGEFTGNFDLGQAPFMTEGADCVWSTTVAVDPGTYNFKFVTDGSFDSPSDYGWMESETYTAPGTFAVRQVGGLGTAIRLQVDTAATYEFTLDERTQTFSVLGQTAVEPVTWGQIKTGRW